MKQTDRERMRKKAGDHELEVRLSGGSLLEMDRQTDG